MFFKKKRVEKREPTQSTPLAKEIDLAIAKRLKEGYCCSEALFLGTMDALPEEKAFDQNLVRVTSGLCGGMGTRESTCGVFTGGAIALGYLAGRTTPDKKDQRGRDLSAQFFKTLSEEAGAHSCRDLLDKFGRVANLNHQKCHQLTRQGGEVLAKIIQEHKISSS
ncbi:C-GCAxxG-C-C family protein [Magnetococcales bacterium HHB-1]